MRGSGKSSRGGRGIGPFDLLRDVLAKALDNGQFPSAVIAIILLAVIWKLSASDLSHLLERLVGFAERSRFDHCWAAIVCLVVWLRNEQHRNRKIDRVLEKGLFAVELNEDESE